MPSWSGPLVALALMCGLFSLTAAHFLEGSNFSIVFQQVMVVAMLGIGQTLIILTAGIDLSCGASMALGSIVMAKVATASGINPYVSMALGVLTCVGIGLLNGVLVATAKLPAFVVTLGTLNIAYALTQVYSNAETIYPLPGAMTALSSTFKIYDTAITYTSLVVLLVLVMTWYLLTKTAWGTHLYAIGNNAEAARLMGIPVERRLWQTYGVAGAIFGLAALLLIARTGAGDPNAGQTENLECITAVVIGGTSLFGGRGSVVGTLVGALILGFLSDGLILLGVESIYQYLVTGILVILAVGVDKLTRLRA